MKKYLNTWWVTDVALFILGIILGIATNDWLGAIVLIPITISLLMPILYFIVLGCMQSDTILTSGETETFGLSENNGALVEIILFSDQFHTRKESEMNSEFDDWRKWDIIRGAEPKSWLEEEMNARWLGMPWNRQLTAVTLRCHRWKNEKDYIGGGTEEKKGHTFDRRVPLFHTHAYITDEIEIKGNLHVQGAFTFRFRITNPYLAFYQTSDVIVMLDAIAKGVTKEEWSTRGFEDLKSAKFATVRNTGEVKWEDLKPQEQEMMGYRLMYFMNAELEKYGIMIIDIHFVDLLDTNEAEREALRAKELAILKGQADVEAARLDAEAMDLETAAILNREKGLVAAVYEGNGRNAKAMTAYALSRMTNLKAFGGGALVDTRDDGETTETTRKTRKP